MTWHESKALPGVKYATRRISLEQRIELTKRARALSLKQEFLQAGETPEQLEGTLVDLLVRRLYLEWGLAELTGLTIDSQSANVELLIEKGPETLSDEIIADIRSELGLSEDERKNY
ncbi:MAG: hypothetical protein JOY62_18675 [Acidobacteriaceae bacterium]|nr:hypothetical protein [Acidobacteriaceae bacterium]MBV9781993.1 hypothetical protein [Acidobacteriaceae bacterium]